MDSQTFAFVQPQLRYPTPLVQPRSRGITQSLIPPLNQRYLVGPDLLDDTAEVRRRSQSQAVDFTAELPVLS
jgi:hypothetical protein